ncbi:MAG TPA: hypothetical protein VF629_13410 [Hymenobacter sp.]|uniref:hypothetical protein n=1 Tax=Hymenobacter sp. TaxID=1898978 RepID=UPI002ED95FFB
MSDTKNLLPDEKPSVVPYENEKHKKTKTPKVDSNTTQNPNQNHISVEGNNTMGASPGGKSAHAHKIPQNKPRSNPQGNQPMSVDRSQKGPGRKAD